MEVTLGITEARKGFSELVEKVQYRGDAYTISRHGRPAAVLVSVKVYEAWKSESEKFFDLIREMQERSNLAPDEAEELTAEAVAAVRAEKRKHEVEKRA